MMIIMITPFSDYRHHHHHHEGTFRSCQPTNQQQIPLKVKYLHEPSKLVISDINATSSCCRCRLKRYE